MIPDNWIPRIKLQFGTLEAKRTSELIYNSGFEIQQAIFPIGIYMFQFYLEFTLICTIYLLIAKMWVNRKWNKYHSMLSNYLGYLALFSFPFRYHIEILMKMFVSIAIEINYMANKYWWSMKVEKVEIVFFTFSLILLLVLTLILIVLIVIAIWKLKKQMTFYFL